MLDDVISSELDAAAVDHIASRWLFLLSEDFSSAHKGSVDRLNRVIAASGKADEMYASGLRKARARVAVPDVSDVPGVPAPCGNNGSDVLRCIRDNAAAWGREASVKDAATLRSSIVSTDVHGGTSLVDAFSTPPSREKYITGSRSHWGKLSWT